jgi:hypothetical protein
MHPARRRLFHPVGIEVGGDAQRSECPSSMENSANFDAFGDEQARGAVTPSCRTANLTA